MTQRRAALCLDPSAGKRGVVPDDASGRITEVVQAGSKGTITVVPPTEKDLYLQRRARELPASSRCPVVEIAIQREGKPNGGFYPEDHFFNGAKPVAEEPAARPMTDHARRFAWAPHHPVDAFG
jgi:hypothetical protein